MYVSSSSPGGGTSQTLDNVVWSRSPESGTGGEVCRLRLHLVSQTRFSVCKAQRCQHFVFFSDEKLSFLMLTIKRVESPLNAKEITEIIFHSTFHILFLF